MCASPFIHTIERVAPFFCVSLGLRDADTVWAVVGQNFEGVAVEEGDDGAREVSNCSGGAEQEQERAESKDTDSCPPHEWKRDQKTPSDETEPSVHRCCIAPPFLWITL